MKILGNLIWLLFGGIWIALEYVIASALLIVTIVGIPFGLQTIKLATVAIWPFGSEVVYTGGIAGGCLSTIMNVLWFFVGGLWIFLTHIVFGALLSVTIIGIPFGMQHFKLAMLALAPFGREIRSK